MKNEMERKNFYIIIAAVAFCIVLSANFYNRAKYHEFRGLCNQYTEQFIATTEANRELTGRIERVAEITGRIKEAADANITDARGIVETIEELRTEIKELEDCCGSFSQLEYYQYYDAYYREEQLME